MKVLLHILELAFCSTGLLYVWIVTSISNLRDDAGYLRHLFWEELIIRIYGILKQFISYMKVGGELF